MSPAYEKKSHVKMSEFFHSSSAILPLVFGANRDIPDFPEIKHIDEEHQGSFSVF